MGLVIRQSIKSSISNYVGLIIGYINILYLMPKVFLPSEMGISRFIIDISGVLAGFASLGAAFSISRFFPKFQDPKNSYHNGFTFWVYSLPLIGLSFLAILLVFSGPSILNLLKDGGSNTTDYIHIIIPLTVIMVYILVTEQYCALFGRIVVVNVVRENGLRLMNLSLLLMVWFDYLSFNQFVFWLLVSYCTVLVIDIIYLFTLNPLSLKPDLEYIRKNSYIRKDFFKYTGINLIGSIGPLLIARSDYFAVSYTGGDTALGIYSMALSIAIMTDLPKRVILPIVQPIISRTIHDQNWKELKSVTGKGNINQTLIGMTILLAIWFNADSIFTLMPNGFKYIDGKWLILILGTGKLFELATVLPGVIINNSHFYRWNLFVTLSCLVTMFTVYFFAVPLWGIYGTALGVALSYVTYAIVNLSIVYKYYKMHWFEAAWLKMVLIFISLILLNHFLPNFEYVWFNILIRSLLLMSVFFILVFKLKLSEDLNRTALELIKGKFRWF
ncbi:MAG: polysaccharide biosynthesis C-terminal domain-containing protein [Flavobacteriales bacterium]|nr:polysaccharide biosynthesis C-terminal domain-containing protein [Flavobacteriales bacterium]